MSDSVDRVFTHALSTVRLLPRTPSSPRPPASERLKLYGLYKQAMEGDVEPVMARPPDMNPDTRGEVEKWDAWHAQAGTSKTEAKRRYISTLIQTMRTYASGSAEARELISELEFVWDQIKSQAATSSSSAAPSPDAQPRGGATGMRVLAPQSSDTDEGASSSSLRRGADGERVGEGGEWRERVERSLQRLTTEVAALREQLQSRSGTWSWWWTGSTRSRKRTTVLGWVGWALWGAVKHVALDALLLLVVLAWLRRRKRRRGVESSGLEDVLERWLNTVRGETVRRLGR